MPDETKIFYYIEDEKTPYAIKLNLPPESITLGDFKAAIKKPNCKYFFRSQDQDFGVVKEEITNDDCCLPLCDNRIVAWLVAPDPPENTSQSSSTINVPPIPGNVSNNHVGTKVDQVGRPTSSHHKKPVVPSNRHLFNNYGSQSTLNSSDVDTLSYDSRDDMSECSTYSELTVSTRSQNRQRRQRYRKKRPKLESDTSSVYSSGITDSSLSLHVINVTLNMDKYNFLGISIVGQSNDRGDGGIYIGSIMKGGAVAADGRIEPGDMLLQVNKINFENMSNEEAVRELRGIVHKPGPITLTIAKCWDPGADSNYFTIPKNEPVRPIDPAVWANNISAVQGCYSGSSPPFTAGHENSSDLASSLPESERYDRLPLSIRTDVTEVVRCMKLPDSGLDVKTRMWLKITIPQAFIGSDLVVWLQQKVEGLSERRDARKYASTLLKTGHIRHTVNKTTFSEQCYYVFGDYADAHHLPQGLSSLSLGDSNSDSRDSDPITVIPGFRVPYPQCAPANPQLTVTSSSKPPQPYSVAPPLRQSDIDSISMTSANELSNAHVRTDSSGARRHLAFGGSGGSASDNASESRLSIRSGVRSSGDKQKSKSGSDKSFPVRQSLKALS